MKPYSQMTLGEVVDEMDLSYPNETRGFHKYVKDPEDSEIDCCRFPECSYPNCTCPGYEEMA